jgi:hypothetical protein
LLLSIRHRALWQCLQREQLLPGSRAHCNPVGDSVADQISQWTAFPVRGEPGVVHVALDQATLHQLAPDALSNQLHQALQQCCGGWRHLAKYGRTIGCWQIHSSKL